MSAHLPTRFMYLGCKKQFFKCEVERTDGSWTGSIRITTVSIEQKQKLAYKTVRETLGNTVIHSSRRLEGVKEIFGQIRHALTTTNELDGWHNQGNLTEGLCS